MAPSWAEDGVISCRAKLGLHALGFSMVVLKGTPFSTQNAFRNVLLNLPVLFPKVGDAPFLHGCMPRSRDTPRGLSAPGAIGS